MGRCGGRGCTGSKVAPQEVAEMCVRKCRCARACPPPPPFIQAGPLMPGARALHWACEGGGRAAAVTGHLTSAFSAWEGHTYPLPAPLCRMHTVASPWPLPHLCSAHLHPGKTPGRAAEGRLPLPSSFCLALPCIAGHRVPAQSRPTQDERPSKAALRDVKRRGALGRIARGL